MKPCRGALALCGKGTLGIITCDYPQSVTYPDGTVSIAYIGIHLTDKLSSIGAPWSSKNPIVIGYTQEEK